jgi:hypothetical protein
MRSKKILTLLIAPLFALGMAACDVDQTEEGALPEVDVQEGELPAYDVEPAEVEITEDTVTVPDIDVNDPDDGTPEDDGTVN